jgi:NAD(P)H-hydrate epimerase
MHVLSAEQMRVCDRAATEIFGVPSIELMRAAAAQVARFAREQFPRARRVTVLCGRGNNGGDGLLAAGLLAGAGLEVTTLLLGAAEGLTGDVATAWSELRASGAERVHVLAGAEELERQKGALDTDLIVDAVVGTGFKAPLRGLAAAAAEWVKGSRAPVLAVDLPSGWGADETGARAAGPVFPSDAVITFTAPKPAHVFGQLTRRWEQPVVVALIGSPAGAVVEGLKVGWPGLHWAGSAANLVRTPRAADSNKGDFGHVLVVGGSVGKSGAPAMTALSALRAGAGLVTAAVPGQILESVAMFAPELMTFPLVANSAGQVAQDNLAQKFLAGLLEKKTVLAIGPGLGGWTETVSFVSGILTATKLPTVIDADGLNILATKFGLLGEMARIARGGRTVVLTPHPGEMARLAGITVAEVQAERLKVAMEFAEKYAMTVVLKGARTVIAHPDGWVAVNTTGNRGMAKGGSGDMLAGLVAGLMAQYPEETERAVEAAVYLHGLAADMAVRRGDEHTLLATDSLAHFSRAFRFRGSGANGYLWLQGLPAEHKPGTTTHEASR